MTGCKCDAYCIPFASLIKKPDDPRDAFSGWKKSIHTLPRDKYPPPNYIQPRIHDLARHFLVCSKQARPCFPGKITQELTGLWKWPSYCTLHLAPQSRYEEVMTNSPLVLTIQWIFNNTPHKLVGAMKTKYKFSSLKRLFCPIKNESYFIANFTHIIVILKEENRVI